MTAESGTKTSGADLDGGDLDGAEKTSDSEVTESEKPEEVIDLLGDLTGGATPGMCTDDGYCTI